MADEVKCDGIVDQADRNSDTTANDSTIRMDNHKEEEDTGSENGPSGQEETAIDAIDCCICQDQVQATKQGHLSHCEHDHFHFDCIIAWAKVTNLCPLCKTKFNVITRRDASGIEVHRQVVKDAKQVYRPDPLDDDLAAQLRLVHEARCELCGSGDDEHVLLLCDAVGCGVANHTYCIGLREVPNTSWYCSRHATTQLRASDAIRRPATTVTTRRRTRRLASLMSNVLRERSGPVMTRPRSRRTSGFGDADEDEDRRPMGGIAAAYAVRMSQELMQVQQRADAMFARGDLTPSSLYEHRDRSAPSGAQYQTRSTIAASGPSTIDRMWDENSRSRQEAVAAAIAARDHGLLGGNGGSIRLGQRSGIVSDTFAAEYCALAKLMEGAVSSDNYASSVSLLIPRTAKLGLVSRVKTFFNRQNEKEKAAAVELGCLPILHQWIRVPVRDGDTTAPCFNPQVLHAVLAILETLPVRREDLVEEEGLQDTMDRLSELSDVSIETRQRIIALGDRWRKLNPPALNTSPRPQVSRRVSSPVHVTHDLPVIASFASRQRPVPANGKRKRDAWSDAVVEYVKAKLYPLYKQNAGAGKLTRERFKAIVKDVANLFSQEASSMQSAVLLPSGELSNLAKSRVKKLIDRVYKESINRASAPYPAASAPLLSSVSGLASAYSAVPSIKPQRRV
uniref:RING-type domain-containing protein n=1 Tax=Peronospora matthiolae TaxID=2874970 RepID=A0AAV1V7J7_9STRA